MNTNSTEIKNEMVETSVESPGLGIAAGDLPDAPPPLEPSTQPENLAPPPDQTKICEATSSGTPPLPPCPTPGSCPADATCPVASAQECECVSGVGENSGAQPLGGPSLDSSKPNPMLFLPGKHLRMGKIAQLPDDIRHSLCQQMYDEVPYSI